MSESESETETEELTTQYHEDGDSSTEEDAEESELENETVAVEKLVVAAADSLNASVMVQLDQAVRDRVVSASTVAANNPGEAFRDPNSTSPRLATITTRLDQALAKLTQGGFSVGTAHAAFLEKVLGIKVAGDGPAERAEAATRLVSTLVQAVHGPTTASPDLSALATAFGTQPDEDYWMQLADDFDGTPESRTGLQDHLVFMGLTIEMKPGGNYIWHSAAQKALFVDELIAASGSGIRALTTNDTPIDVASVYRRAALLTFEGTPLPRPVVAELVRMAIAELSQGIQLGKVPLEAAPTKTALSRYLGAEPVPSNATPAERVDIAARNGMRSSALALADATITLTADTSSGKAQGPERDSRVAARAGRGQLAPLLDYLIANSTAASAALKGGSTVAKIVQQALDGSGIRDAVSAWDTLYRSGETDPAKLQGALDDLTTRVSGLSKQLKAMFGQGKLGSAQASGLSVLSTLPAVTSEIAAEAGELLEGHRSRPDPLAAPHALADAMTAQSQSRGAAIAKRDLVSGKAAKLESGLGPYVADSLKLFELKPWHAQLKTSADAWSTASTHDYAQIAQATVDLTAKLDAAGTALDALLGGPDSPERRTGRAALDAIAYAVQDRLLSLAQIDPQTAKLNMFDALANGTDDDDNPTGLNKWLNPFAPPTNVADYWSTQKGTVKAPPTGGAFTKALTAWQKAASATTPNPADLATKTYEVVRLLSDYRRQVLAAKAKAKPADTAKMLGILDSIAMAVANKTASR